MTTFTCWGGVLGVRVQQLYRHILVSMKHRHTIMIITLGML